MIKIFHKLLDDFILKTEVQLMLGRVLVIDNRMPEVNCADKYPLDPSDKNLVERKMMHVYHQITNTSMTTWFVMGCIFVI